MIKLPFDLLVLRRGAQTKLEALYAQEHGPAFNIALSAAKNKVLTLADLYQISTRFDVSPTVSRLLYQAAYGSVDE